MRATGARSAALLVLLTLLPQLLSAARADEAPDSGELNSVVQTSASEFREDLRGQAYVFGGVGAMNNVGSMLYELGGGYDFLIREGLGVGLELSALGDQSSGLFTAGGHVSHHFLPESPGVEPFVLGGVSFGGAAEYGLGGYVWATAGGGMNYWFGNGMALRVEARGRFDVQGDDDHAAVLRAGLTF